MRPTDPRVRQTLNQISQTVESAQYNAQASLFSFTQNYINPCLASVTSCLEASCQPCHQCLTAARTSDPHHHHSRKRHPNHRRRGREELSFDFYDDWEEDEREWGNDELDRLLAGNEQDNGAQPGRRRGMSYGGIASRRKTISMGGAKDAATDANMVPSSSMFGFLERLPWKIGGRGKRYRPSAADLQDVGEGTRHKAARGGSGSSSPLISSSGEEDEGGGRNFRSSGGGGKKGHGRNRSETVTSRETTTASLSSRGDLFPSDGEDDAVPLDDEFTIALERRTTAGTTSDEQRSSKQRPPNTSRGASTRTKSSAADTHTTTNDNKPPETTVDNDNDHHHEIPSLTDLKEEEDRLRTEEETEIQRNREAAQRLAKERGLSENSPEDKKDDEQPPNQESKTETSVSIHPVASRDGDRRRRRRPSSDEENLSQELPRRNDETG